MSSPASPPSPQPSDTPSPLLRRALIASLAALVLLAAVVVAIRPQPSPGVEVPYSQALTAAADGSVKTAELDEGKLQVHMVDRFGVKSWSDYPQDAGADLAATLKRSGAEVTVAHPSPPSMLTGLLYTLLPVLLILAFLTVMLRRGGLGGGLGGLSLGKRGGPVAVPDTRFSDVAGIDEAVEDLKEVVDFLHDPDRFTLTGAKVPRGYLLAGPPGTGKTLLARAVAGEAGVPFFAISGSDFVDTFVGRGAARVRELFGKARAAGRAIVFVDEIDAVGKARASGPSNGANDERESTLNQLLVEMDGFSRTPGIIMIAATNRADVLDPALRRPGRFDRTVTVPAPDRGGRERILRLYATGRPFADDIDWAVLARRIPGMTGAEIEQLVNEAALEAARQGRVEITMEHLEAALATSVLGRERRSAVITERDREIVAWHEAGHTVAAMLLPDADRPSQVTIVPRGGAGGVTWMTGSEHDFLTRKQAAARLVVAMAGRAAEEILLRGDYTHGAHGDLQSATALAKDMITRYGMGEHLVSMDQDRMAFGGLERVEAEVSAMLADALTGARALLAVNDDLLRALVEALLEAETLREDDLAGFKERFAPAEA